MKPTLLASASSLENIVGMVNEYYGCLRTLELTADEGGQNFTLANANGPIQNVRIAFRRGRFRFERLN